MGNEGYLPIVKIPIVTQFIVKISAIAPINHFFLYCLSKIKSPSTAYIPKKKTQTFNVKKKVI